MQVAEEPKKHHVTAPGLAGASSAGTKCPPYRVVERPNCSCIGEPFGMEEELRLLLRSLCSKQDRVEERIEAWCSVIFEYLQRIIEDISPPVAPAGRGSFSPGLERCSGASTSNDVATQDNTLQAKLEPIPANSTACSHPSSFSHKPSAKAGSVPTSWTVSQHTDGTAWRPGRNSWFKNNPELHSADNKHNMEHLKEELDRMHKKTTCSKLRTSMLEGSKTWNVRKKKEITLLQKFTRHMLFDWVCSVMILLNSVLIGVETEYQSRTSSSENLFPVLVLGHTCTGFFIVELMLRLLASGWEYFADAEDKWWNVFDTLLVLLSIVDIFMGMFSSGTSGKQIGKAFKTIKMLRILRLLRVFRFFKELGLLALMIADSMVSLLWAVLMLGIIMYVFAVCFTQNATVFLADQPRDAKAAMVRKQFGSLARTHYSLVLSMLGGISWGEVCDTVVHMDPPWTSVFLFYIAFTMLAVLNIITGVFVDNAVETGRTQRDYIIQKEREVKERLLKELGNLFQEMDDDGSGTLSWDEMSEHLKSEAVRGYFAALGLNADDMKRLFILIDDQKLGEVSIEEFLEGCLRLKGEAKSIDVHTVLHECRKLNRRHEESIEEVNRSHRRLHTAISKVPGIPGILDALSRTSILPANSSMKIPSLASLQSITTQDFARRSALAPVDPDSDFGEPLPPVPLTASPPRPPASAATVSTLLGWSFHHYKGCSCREGFSCGVRSDLSTCKEDRDLPDGALSTVR